MSTAGDPHAGGPVAEAGAPLSRARCAVILLHGRGGGAQDMLGLAEHLALPEIAYLAPQAAGRSWWPQSFLAPLAANEPGLGSALRAVDHLVLHLDGHGFAADRVALLGFSQGACLALEYGARSGRGLRALVGLSGGLVGTAEGDGPPRPDLYGHAPKCLDYSSRLPGTAVILGCHERDPHIPLARVHETQAVFERLGARVSTRIYPGAGHAVLDDELRLVRGLLNG